jgi:hydroxyacylglutathione hydrolase
MAEMDVVTVETASLGDRTYVVHDGDVALVVDPQRDIDRVMAAAADVGVRITHIAETHVHNDYVSGGLTLARVTGATYVHAAHEPLRFDHEPVSDGDRFIVGQLTVDVVHTPGHTPHHLTYIVRGAEGPPAAFTGGSLLYGTVGRTDLIDPASTDGLTRAQFQSVHRLANRLPDDARVYPTHGFGSFCSSVASDEESDGTLGTERRVNVALTTADEDAFVARLVAELDDVPRYYAQMSPLNLAGGIAVDLSEPAAVDPVELARRIHRGEWVVDLRHRRSFASNHLSGTIGIELADEFSTYLAWLLPWGMPLTMLADSVEEIREAQRQLVRVGIDRPAGAASGGIDRWSPDADRSSYRVIRFADLADEPDLPVLDVRLPGEYADRHLVDAIHVPLGDLLRRIDEVSAGPIAVHCASGYRASIASSILDRSGRDVALVDDDFDHAADSGREMRSSGD